MRRSVPWFAYVIFGLAAIGLLFQLAAGAGGLLIPLLVFGIIFLLYKFPPSRFRRSRSGSSSSTGKQRNGPTRKARFRVIPGSKTNGDDEPPRYH